MLLALVIGYDCIQPVPGAEAGYSHVLPSGGNEKALLPSLGGGKVSSFGDAPTLSPCTGLGFKHGTTKRDKWPSQMSKLQWAERQLSLSNQE